MMLFFEILIMSERSRAMLTLSASACQWFLIQAEQSLLSLHTNAWQTLAKDCMHPSLPP